MPQNSEKFTISQQFSPETTQPHDLHLTPSQTRSAVQQPNDVAAHTQVENEPTQLNVFYQNVRGLRTKIDDFFTALHTDFHDVIVLTETWLNEEINSLQLFGQHYSVYRKDRDPLTSGKKSGGGVLIAIANRLSSESIPLTHNDLEHICVKIAFSQHSLYIGAVYLSPDISTSESVIGRNLDAFSAIIEQMQCHDELIIFGDYNQPQLNWKRHDDGSCYPDPTTSKFSSSSTVLIDRMSTLNLVQINSVSNENKRTLDLVLVDRHKVKNFITTTAAEGLVPIDKHHPPLVTSVEIRCFQSFCEPIEAPSLNFRKANFTLLNELLRSVDWSDLAEAGSIDDAVAHFSSTVNSFLQQTVPLKSPVPKPPWSNPQLRRLKRMRASALKSWSYHRNPTLKSAFTSASNAYRRYNRALYTRYLNQTQMNLKQNPRRFWSFINDKRKEKGLPLKMFLENEVCDSITGQCELFAKHFASVFTTENIEPAEITRALSHVVEDAMNVNVPIYQQKSNTPSISSNHQLHRVLMELPRLFS
ncbi:uncharacterized protein LOC129753526 [Uranotaenia lowii]|uniref:uncharacterized protein LOC129753526 n=1 Tax=Uranotaenia lowii TaxID=190385 RepID=UPI0024798879|nr:uncharacterized protein LOC129753526 [Uranotaenia lowii]